MRLTRSITTLFMVKPLGIGIEKLEKVGFINGFIRDVSHDSIYENCVYLLFKPHDMDLFRDFIDSEYERTDNIDLLDKDCIPKPVRTFKIYSQRL